MDSDDGRNVISAGNNGAARTRVAGRRDVLTQTRQIAAERLGGFGGRVFLFGSWARGEERGTSDIDLGILCEEPTGRGLIAELQSDYDESTIPYRVEVVDLRTVGDGFRAKVLAEGVEWSV